MLSVKGRWITFTVFILLTVMGIFLAPLVTINYDMRKYLPKDSKTKQTLEILEDEFGSSSMIQVMVSDLDVIQTNQIVTQIMDIENIDSVIWLGTVVDIYQPFENIDSKYLTEYHNDGKFLLTIEFMSDEYSLETEKSIAQIKELIDKYNIKANYRGPAIANIYARNITKKEALIIMGVVVPIAILILFLAASSWIEPVVVLISLIIGVVINLGTNFVISSISFVTIAIASVLQLAMSLDYSLFIVHRYYEKRDEGFQPVEAAISSTKDAFSSVSTSALTTIFGFLALVFMRYSIGQDIGLSLAKAIVISFITVIMLMPSLVVIFDKALLKTRHKQLIPNFDKISEGLFKGRYVVSVLLILVALGAFFLQTKTHYAYGDTPSNDPKLTINIDEKQIHEYFGNFQPVVILYKNGEKSKAITLVDKLLENENISKIQSLVTDVDKTIPDELIPHEIKQKFVGPNYTRMIAYFDIDAEGQLMYELSDYVIENAKMVFEDEFYIVGVPTSTAEIKKTVMADGIVVKMISVLTIALIIGLMFKSLFIPIVLVGLIETSIWINISLSYLSGSIVIYIGYLIVTALQLGATIDYAVLLTSRYQEFRQSMLPREAMLEAMRKSAPTIIISSAVLATAGFAEALVSQLGIVKEIGLLLGRGALLSGLMVIFILPAVIMALDKPMQALTFNKLILKEKGEN